MLDAITKFVFTIINGIANLFTGVILDIMQTIIPELAIPFQKISYFFNTYVWDILSWIRRVCVNVLCFPNELFHFLIGLYSLKVLLTQGARLVLFVLNVYRTYKGNTTLSLAVSNNISGYGYQEYRGWYSIE